MIRKLILILAALLIASAPGGAQAPAPQPPAKAQQDARPPLAPKDAPGAPRLPRVAFVEPAVNVVAVDTDDDDNAADPAERKAERAEEQREREREKEQERIEREEELYDNATEAMDEGQWEKAVEHFTQVVAMKGKKADGALYWKAYAENKLGRKADALTTLGELQKSFPKSNWLKDAKALEIEVRGGSGQAVGSGQAGIAAGKEDEELKILAINILMHTDPERAVPILEKCLQNAGLAHKLKEKCLFVLSQGGSPRSREIIGQIARGQSNPDLQRKAIEYLGLFGGRESRQILADIYASSSDVDMKLRILRSFMLAGEKDRLLAAARGEKVAELRAEAIQQLGLMGAREQIWQLYQQESSVEVKGKIVQAMFLGGDADHMVELARVEKDSTLRLKAVRNLGLMGSQKTGDALVALYTGEKDSAVRKEVLNAFFLQGNARQLIEVARKETDPELKRTAVQKLSLMGSKEATDFLMEILNKP